MNDPSPQQQNPRETGKSPERRPRAARGNRPEVESAGPRDAELVRRSLAGELEAFEELIRRYQRAIFGIAYYKSRNPYDAEDLSQDIFLAAYRALATLKDHENFGGWLIGIAHNRCHKWFRRERTKILKFREIRDLRRQELRSELRRSEPGADPGAHLATELRKLPHEIRTVLVLKYLEGLSYEAIEERLGLKPYRIDYLIRKGKALLRQRLRHTSTR